MGKRYDELIEMHIKFLAYTKATNIIHLKTKEPAMKKIDMRKILEDEIGFMDDRTIESYFRFYKRHNMIGAAFFDMRGLWVEILNPFHYDLTKEKYQFTDEEIDQINEEIKRM